ncbi:putative signal transducing protein [Capnocytophaga sp. ARDL2]|uniref:putative signal transducing protein n=1 Tax=Capnocytophaga sp. ARDL2 TaxID=3238809 RepID=UPI003558A12D
MEKIFSGSQVLAIAVKEILDQHQIGYAVRDDINSGIVAGFGTLGKAVHIFVEPENEERALQLIENLKEME